MNNRSWSSSIIIIILFAIIIFLLFNYSNKTSIVTECYTKTDTIFSTETLTVRPHLKALETLKIDTVVTNTSDTLKLITERLTYRDTVFVDADTAIVDATVSGINASLDTLQIQLKKHNYAYTNSVYRTKTIDRGGKKIHISPQLGLGYGLINKKADIYIGVGLSIDL